MKLFKRLRNLFLPKRDLLPILSQQAAFFYQAAAALEKMLDSSDREEWGYIEREIKTLEVQGDALLTEFQEQVSGRLKGSLPRADLQSIAMALDDCLDVVKDASKALGMYNPAKIDPQLKDLVSTVVREAESIKVLLPMLWDIKHKVSSITLECDRITELEHTADDTYEEYVGYIFANEPDLRELTKYKNLAEIFEKSTDTGKRVADNVRVLLLQFNIEKS